MDDLASVGVRPRDMDPGHLDDAAQRLFRGGHDTGADAYEASALAREAGGSRGAAQALDAVPFDGPTAAAASDALPIGDTAPLEAMQRARGLFRQYQQTFRPHGPGDTAGANLRRIVERDASSNEVAAMLFGSPGSGKVQAGQLQTLARLRDAIGADSEPWQAVQRGLIARHLGGEGRDLLDRVRYLVRGEADRKAVAKAMDLIAGAIAFKVGGLPAAAGTYGAKVGQRAMMGGVGAAAARRSFEGDAPRLLAPPPGYATSAGSSTGRLLAPLGVGN